MTCEDGKTCVPNGTPDPCVSDVVACQGDACGITGEKPLSAPAPAPPPPPPPEADGGIVDAAVDATVPPPVCRSLAGTDTIVTGVSRALSPLPMFPSSSTAAYWFDSSAKNLRRFDVASRVVSTVDTLAGEAPHAFAASSSTLWSARTSTVNASNEDVFRGNGNLFGMGVARTQTMVVVSPPVVANETVFLGVTGSIKYWKDPGPVGTFTVSGAYLSHLTYDTQYLYWLENGFLRYRLLDGSGSTTMLDPGFQGLATSGAVMVYSRTDGTVGKFVNHARVTLDTNDGGVVVAVAADKQYLYWSSPDGIFRVPLSGAGPRELLRAATGETFSDLAVTGDSPGCVYYWARPNGGPDESLKVLDKP